MNFEALPTAQQIDKLISDEKLTGQSKNTLLALREAMYGGCKDESMVLVYMSNNIWKSQEKLLSENKRILAENEKLRSEKLKNRIKKILNKINMKKLFLIIAAIALFASCQKCAECTQIITTTVTPSTPGYPQTTTTTFDACDDELKEVNGKTLVTTSVQGSITATSTSKTVCK